LPVPQLSDFVTHFIFAPHEEFDGLLNEIAASDIVLQIESIHLRPGLVLVPVPHASRFAAVASHVGLIGRWP
jgi:hypothetical protein